MPIESNARSRSISLGVASRRNLGEGDGHSSQEDNYDEHDVLARGRSKRFDPVWLLVLPLLLLLSIHDGKQVLFDNDVATTVQGLYALGGLLSIVSFGTAWYQSLQGLRKLSSHSHVMGSINSRAIFTFASNYRLSVTILGCTSLVRIILQLRLARSPQCSIPGIEGFVALAYLVWRNWVKHARSRPIQLSSSKLGVPSPYSKLHFGQNLKIAILLGLSAWTTSSMLAHPRSTMVCESSLAVWVTLFQILSTVLDICIIASMESCFEGFSDLNISILSGWSLLISMVCFLCAPLVLILSFVFKLASNMENTDNLNLEYYKAFAWELCIVFLLLLLVGRIISSGGAMALLSAFIGVFVTTNLLPALRNRENLLTLDYAQLSLATSCLIVAFAGHHLPRGSQKGDPNKWRTRFDYMFYCTVGLTACTIVLGYFADYDGIMQDHPVDALIYSADQAHETWVSQAKQSQSLREAVLNYQKRYKRLPPPNFHVWYNFAIARNSDIIDDFDSIERDLAPFRALSPAELRERVKESVDDAFNEVGLIKIRGGKAVVDQRFEGHGWTMDVVVLMAEYFMHSLPDLDIPFNINDEPRVVVPYKQMQEYLSKRPPSQPSSIAKNFSTNTGELLDKPRRGSHDSTFENWSFRNNFKKYSTLACAPDSAALQTRWSWLPSRFCISCANPHSTSHFIEDWKHAGDPCHQPDLETLHGFYQGPGSYKITTKLLPIFSSGKPQGYADILFPSLWEWDDGQRPKYAPNAGYPSPNYANKSTTLFWRGTTAEGFTRRGEWRTFSRQRFVHMTSKGRQSLPVYLPESKGSDTYKVEHLNRKSLVEHASMKSARLKLDTGFTKFEKAWDDWMYEEKVFGTAETEDFQANWQHKFLMSLDESSADRSFIPFVQSSSLPFKATIFQEWFDDRLKAWKHFVPIDLRFRGLWSNLAYFAGQFGTIRSVEGMDAGEFIAESGRLWGSRVLRRDDMEIYFFRLLLEWGRLLDDQRDELGFEL